MEFSPNLIYSIGRIIRHPVSSEVMPIGGKGGSNAVLVAADGDMTLTGDADPSNRDDAMLYDVEIGGDARLRLIGFSAFDLGAGRDVLDLTVRPRNANAPYEIDVVASGGTNQDVLWLGEGNDIVYGESEVLDSGRGAADRIHGGGGDDTIYGDARFLSVSGGSDRIHGGNGNDTIYGDGGGVFRGHHDVLYGGAGNDVISGDGSAADGSRGGHDTVYGGDGNDMLMGEGQRVVQGGDDQLYGGAGDDYIWGEGSSSGDGSYGGDDVIYGGAGHDILSGDFEVQAASGGDDVIYGGAGNDAVYGDAVYHDEELTPEDGDGGNDRLYGGDGNDAIYGDAVQMDRSPGRDIIVGGRGNDLLYGDANDRVSPPMSFNPAADQFVFAPSDGNDIIGDFDSALDTIDFSAWGFTSFEAIDILENGSSEVTILLDDDDSIIVQSRGFSLTLTEDDFLLN
ncbi:calcium-binding protein [Marinivivus vitaminiproducens]|uniref:calcium-binding protein n=1 Tax=Marinivivus vitaminiproducens TaxID=3035935 RepID=UPI0027AA39E3|nr:calcium-binding protein [Geminicoccaceae bacterium SCSIO 64248]